MLLRSNDISVHRAGTNKIEFPDININPGEKTIILGASGSGKTTLLSMLGGLLKPNTGQITLEKQDLYAMPSAQRDQIRGQNFGFIFQTFHLIPSLTVAQNIGLAANINNLTVDQERLNYLLRTLGILNKTHKYPNTLSQGEQQRVAIARAVLLRPKIILADEPTSSLDDKNALTVIQLLEDCAADMKSALLIATHDMRLKDRFQNIINLDSQKGGDT